MSKFNHHAIIGVPSSTGDSPFAFVSVEGDIQQSESYNWFHNLLITTNNTSRREAKQKEKDLASIKEETPKLASAKHQLRTLRADTLNLIRLIRTHRRKVSIKTRQIQIENPTAFTPAQRRLLDWVPEQGASLVAPTPLVPTVCPTAARLAIDGQFLPTLETSVVTAISECLSSQHHAGATGETITP